MFLIKSSQRKSGITMAKPMFDEHFIEPEAMPVQAGKPQSRWNVS
jgi:hypothetical protein